MDTSNLNQTNFKVERRGNVFRVVKYSDEEIVTTAEHKRTPSKTSPFDIIPIRRVYDGYNPIVVVKKKNKTNRRGTKWWLNK